MIFSPPGTIYACARALHNVEILPLEHQLSDYQPTYLVNGRVTAVRGRFVDLLISPEDTLQVMMPPNHGLRIDDTTSVTVKLGRSNRKGLVGFVVDEKTREARTRSKLVQLVRATAIKKNVSIRQACLMAGVDPSRFARLEAGKGEVGINQIRKTCKLMQLPASFFEGEEMPVDSELIAKLQTLEDAASGQIEALQVEIASLHDVIRSAFALRCAISAGDPEKNRKARAALASAVEAIRDVR